MGKFEEQLGEIVKSTGLVLTMQVISIVINVATSFLMHYSLIYVLLIALSTALLVMALIVLHSILSRIKELYLTRIRDAVWAHKAALDVNRESRELWIKARPYVIILPIIIIISLSSIAYSLVKPLGLTLPYGVIAWINLTLLMTVLLTEIYVIAKLDCAIWI